MLLTATVLVIMFRSRARAVREKKISSAYFRTFQGETEPEFIAKPSRHFVNLFEAPTLFYVACLAAMVTQTGGRAAPSSHGPTSRPASRTLSSTLAVIAYATGSRSTAQAGRYSWRCACPSWPG